MISLLSRLLRRRRAQGMTEYIVIVGLVGILLVAAVSRYREQIEVTIMGSAGNKGMTGAMKDVEDGMGSAGSNGGGPSHPADGSPAGKLKGSNGGVTVFHDGNGGYRDANNNQVDANDIE